MRWTPRVRRVLARRPWIHWMVVGLLATVVGAAVASSLAGVRRERDSWGTSRSVLVATRDLGPGDALTGATAWRDVPSAMVPGSAIDADATMSAAAATAIQHIADGEIIVAADVSAASGPAALLPPGWSAIEIADAGASGLFRPGDRAAVLADGRTVAAEAIVVTAGPTVVVGVPFADAAAVADAVSRRSAVVALRSTTSATSVAAGQ